MKQSYITELRKGYMEDGGVCVFGGPNNRGGAAEGAKLSANVKVTRNMMIAVAKYVDEEYSKGKVFVRRKLVAYILYTYNVRIHKTTAGTVCVE